MYQAYINNIISMQKNEKISLRRKALSFPPSFNIVTGNLVEVVESIHRDIYRTLNGLPDEQLKERASFFCIINPPRHGKSLLLDMLFNSKYQHYFPNAVSSHSYSNVIVIPITYNSSDTSFDPLLELTSVDTLLTGLWLRVFQSLFNLHLDINDKTFLINEKIDFSFILETAEKYFDTNPFYYFDKKNTKQPKNIIIAIDEFSIVFDSMKRNMVEYWQDHQKSFLSRLNNWKRYEGAFRQFVMTCFNTNMLSQLETSSSLQTYSLQLNDINLKSTNEIIIKIISCYEQKGDLNNFPWLVLECVKSTPGLLGHWGHQITAENPFFWSTIDHMTADIVWFQKITSNEITKGNTKPTKIRNWEIILKYLKALETNPLLMNSYIKELIDAEMSVGINSSGSIESTPALIPSCLVVIVLNLQIEEIDAKDQSILKCLQAIIQSCDDRKEKIQKTGKPFEEFFLNVLKLRILLRCDNNLSNICINWSELFPSLNSYCIQFKTPNFPMKNHWFFHYISNKTSLQSLLLLPLYYLFPLGKKHYENLLEVNKSQITVIDSIKSTSNYCSLANWITQENDYWEFIEVQQIPEDDVDYEGELTEYDENNEEELICESNEEENSNNIALLILNSNIYIGTKIYSDPLNFSFSSPIKNFAQTPSVFFLPLFQSCQSIISTKNDQEFTIIDIKFEDIGYFQKPQYALINGKLKSFWNDFVKKLIVFRDVILDQEIGFIIGNDGKAGSEFIMITRLPNNDINIIAIELKDRRSTESKDWNKKMKILTSYHYIFVWFSLLFNSTEKKIYNHFIFCGRENY